MRSLMFFSFTSAAVLTPGLFQKTGIHGKFSSLCGNKKDFVSAEVTESKFRRPCQAISKKIMKGEPAELIFKYNEKEIDCISKLSLEF
ncbi:hypothetical protein P0136_05450 [Lentisphaerota bacterium ZTH]|nr:hypothetical protein JYG24_03435 [Lentisphaerota bacterium]WET07436.1 hypothetical protein P0136_05450 [Lentisphaerota bacterium ZTH]